MVEELAIRPTAKYRSYQLWQSDGPDILRTCDKVLSGGPGGGVAHHVKLRHLQIVRQVDGVFSLPLELDDVISVGIWVREST